MNIIGTSGQSITSLPNKIGGSFPNSKEGQKEEKGFVDLLSSEDSYQSRSGTSGTNLGSVAVGESEHEQNQQSIVSQNESYVKPSLKEFVGFDESLTQRTALKTFLSRMKSDLNIQPEELISAFSNLSEEELLSPPEESMKTLIGHLNLSADNSVKAEKYFQEMLEQTNTSLIADRFQSDGSGLSIKIMSKRDLQNQKIQNDIQKLSHHFFVNPPRLDQSSETDQKDLYMPISDHHQGSSDHSNMKSSQFFMGGSLGAIGDQSVKGMDYDQATVLSTKAIINGSTKTPIDYNENSFLLGENTLGENPLGKTSNTEIHSISNYVSPEVLKSLNITDIKHIEPNPLVEAKEVVGSGFDNTIGESLGAQGLGGIINENAQDSDRASSDSLDGNSSDGLLSEGIKINDGTGNNSTKEFHVQSRPQLTDVQESENVNEVVSQARALLKNGGGEMRIQMNPHGLGEVTMKVQVENGIVNIEMLADTQEAKNLLEKGVSELKSTLASHKLNLENIKVDTSADLMGDLAEKQKDAERQFAQQFMGEFRRNNQSWRNGFFDMTGVRAYRSQTQDEAENPLLVAKAMKNGAGEQKRLNLVA